MMKEKAKARNRRPKSDRLDQHQLSEKITFSVAMVQEQIKPKTKATRDLVEELRIAERQATALTLLFNRQNYLTVEAVEDFLKSSNIGAVPLGTVLGFLAGYLSAEHYHSQFDQDVFGNGFSMTDDKKHPTGAALIALLAFAEKTQRKTLPG